jgi:class 3 adenylate cyclase/tetratricopeptide (TPR) repeat protein
VGICGECRQVNRENARFCDGCGVLLASDAPIGETRKTLTAVFCDVVGSTPLGERLDAEVLRSVLRRYFDEMREVVERHGGQVSKFIGDAVVGIFGIPHVREDDALRAVRAADEMRTRLATLNTSLKTQWGVELQARTGVCTGEVVVDARDEVVLGDVMNTAARLEQAAGPGEILIAHDTWALVRDAVVAESADLVVKGKSAPVRAWRLRAVDREAAGHRRRFDRPLVGRERELRTLQELLERALEGTRLQLATIIGEPGIGKSRLVAELEAWVDARSDAVTRRRGRCLAYGDGIGFWPLAEIVRQHLAIDEVDKEDLARARLAAAVEGMQDAPWLRARLAPLVGLPAEAAEREEVFTAWQRFFDEVAACTPLLLVFEDLHWADPAVLAFIQHLAEWSTGVPILVVCTARPELFDLHPGWASGLVNATTLALLPLSRDDTARLVKSLLGDLPASPDATAVLVDRSGGNPLYAEEYARLLADRGDSASSDLVMPETVRAVIAARLDSLPVDGRGLLRDAAVCGKVFWAGALAAIGGREPGPVRVALHELARKELIRRSRTSTLPGDEEYAFWHDLVHEVVYNQIPRADRADKHRRTAEWIEQATGERMGDRAELLAHHYAEALALTRTTAQGEPEPLRRAALRHLTIAAERAMGLDADHATRLTRQGLELAFADDAERARLLCVLGTALAQAGEFDEARALLRSARDAAEAVRDVESLGAAFLQETFAVYISGDGRAWEAIVDEAIEKLKRERVTGQFALMLIQAGVRQMFRRDMAAAASSLERALEISRALDDQFAVALSLTLRGLLRAESSDHGALDDLESSVERFLELGSPWLAMAKFHLGLGRLVWNGPAEAAPVMQEAIDIGVRTHNTSFEIFARVVDIVRLQDSGEWDALLAAADRVLAWANANGALQYSTRVAAPKGRVLALRGDLREARRAMTDVLTHARDIIDAQALVPALTAAALIECMEGNADQARARCQEIAPGQLYSTAPIGDILRVLVACDGASHARALSDQLTDGPPRLLHSAASARALLAEAGDDLERASGLYEDAASRWRSYGNPFEHAHALAGGARCLMALNRADAAKAHLEQAAAIFQQLGVRNPICPEDFKQRPLHKPASIQERP